MNRVPCEVYSRVVGYLRPTASWNVGKKKEWEEREFYSFGKLKEKADEKESKLH